MDTTHACIECLTYGYHPPLHRVPPFNPRRCCLDRNSETFTDTSVMCFLCTVDYLAL
jgi:hypothetical protein